MNRKNALLRLLRPHPVIIVLLCVVSLPLTIRALVIPSQPAALSIAAYALAFVSLVMVCLRIPDLVRAVQRFRRENRYYLHYTSDVQLRMSLSLWGSFAFNAAYALFQLGLGLWHHSAFFYAMAGYYLLLGGLRLMLARAVCGHAPDEDNPLQWRLCRRCGAWLLLMTLVLTVVMLYFIFRIRDFRHHEITVIAMAACTFTALALAIVNVVRYRKYNSPVYSAAKALSLVSACMSVVTLENAMFTAFGQDMAELSRQILLGVTGAVVALVVFTLSVMMIRQAHRALSAHENKH